VEVVGSSFDNLLSVFMLGIFVWQSPQFISI
jgi:hypothetical protein